MVVEDRLRLQSLNIGFSPGLLMFLIVDTKFLMRSKSIIKLHHPLTGKKTQRIIPHADSLVSHRLASRNVYVKIFPVEFRGNMKREGILSLLALKSVLSNNCDNLVISRQRGKARLNKSRHM